MALVQAEPLGRTSEAASPPRGWRDHFVIDADGLRSRLTRFETFALAGVLLLASVLDLFRLNTEGYGNTYYAAAVKSMLTSWHNFFFVSFDPGGFVSVDKPPLGLWIQSASVKLLGFHGWSLLLPQAVAGVISVAVIYLMVRRAYGPVAGLLAGLALAVTPISVVTNRNNTIDSLLVLMVLLGAWAVSLAAERGSLRLLLLCATLVGLGFNIKMLQAYLVVPAFGLTYLLGAPLRWRTRLWHLAVGGLVLLAVSLSWALAVDLTPAGARPYVGSSGANAELSLIVGYNGLGRLTQALPAGLRTLPFVHIPIDIDVAPAFAPGIGTPGPFRLLNADLAGQLGWLLLPAVAGLVAGAVRARRRLPLDREGQALVLWGGWLLTAGSYFSFARFFHVYYLVMLAPPVAALAGIGVAALWREYRRSGVRLVLLPALLLAAAAEAHHILFGYPVWNHRLTPLLTSAGVLAAAVLVAGRLLPRLDRRIVTGVTSAGVLILFAAPTVWAAVSVQDGAGGAWLPEAGPSHPFGFPGRGGLPAFGRAGPSFASAGRNAAPASSRTSPAAGGSARGGRPGSGPRGGFGGAQGAMTFAGADWDPLDPGLVRFLEENQGSARNLVATPTSSYASLFILLSGKPVLALGGYQGWDGILTLQRLQARVAAGDVRFFFLPAGGSGFSASGAGTGGTSVGATNDVLLAWVRSSCAQVPSGRWQTASAARSAPASTHGVQQTPGASGSGGAAGGGQQLYDCAA